MVRTPQRVAISRRSVLIVANRFLLKYTTRDAVDVLTTGTGGAHEARAAVAQYEDKSPLYGLLLYRRRKVLVKYIPEGTSRLLQGTPNMSTPMRPSPLLPGRLAAQACANTTPSPRSRPLHYRDREIHTARHCPFHHHPRRA